MMITFQKIKIEEIRNILKTDKATLAQRKQSLKNPSIEEVNDILSKLDKMDMNKDLAIALIEDTHMLHKSTKIELIKQVYNSPSNNPLEVIGNIILETDEHKLKKYKQYLKNIGTEKEGLVTQWTAEFSYNPPDNTPNNFIPNSETLLSETKSLEKRKEEFIANLLNLHNESFPISYNSPNIVIIDVPSIDQMILRQ